MSLADENKPLERTADNDPKLAKERDLLRDRLACENLLGLRERVAYILNHYSETRNSDVSLAIMYWKVFEPEYIQGNAISFENLYLATRIDDISRMRAKIQNQFGLYLADEEVQLARKGRRLEHREEFRLSDAPRPALSIYADESGKNKRFALVGSLWLTDTRATSLAAKELLAWINLENKGNEFHFVNISKNNIELYKSFFSKALTLISHFSSFKATVVVQHGTKKAPDEVYTELYYQTIYEGLRHEIEANRIKLPRDIEFRKDKERHDDSLTLSKLKQDLELRVSQAYNGQARLREFYPIVSHENPFIQIIDLFTSSINRILNETNSGNHKDDFSRFVCDSLALKVFNAESVPSFVSARDSAVVHFLDDIQAELGSQLSLKFS